MDIVVKARNTEVDDRFRAAVHDKLGRLAKLDPKADRVDVEVAEERNPRQADGRMRVELTCRTRGPVIRAEACAADEHAALDLAIGKLDMRLRRAADRRRTRHQQHHGHASQVRGAARVDPEPADFDEQAAAAADLASAEQAEEVKETAGQNGNPGDDGVVMSAGPLVVREKAHDATPLSLDDALHRMELVGHDFYLFCDAESGLPSVVYRRRGYTYGVLRLRAPDDASADAPPA